MNFGLSREQFINLLENKKHLEIVYYFFKSNGLKVGYKDFLQHFMFWQMAGFPIRRKTLVRKYVRKFNDEEEKYVGDKEVYITHNVSDVVETILEYMMSKFNVVVVELNGKWVKIL